MKGYAHIMLRLPKIMFIVLALLMMVDIVSGVAAEKSNTGILTDLDRGLFNASAKKNQVLGEKVTYSAAYDRWFKDYLEGRDAQAQADWAEVLKSLQGATDIEPVLKRLDARLDMMDDVDDPKYQHRGNLMVANRFLLAATEKTLGSDAPLSLSMLENTAAMAWNVKNWDTCFSMYQRLIDTRKRVCAKEYNALCRCLDMYTRALIDAQRYREAMVYAQQQIDVGRQHNAKNLIKRGTNLKEQALFRLQHKEERNAIRH
jgi:hypothetical protein